MHSLVKQLVIRYTALLVGMTFVVSSLFLVMRPASANVQNDVIAGGANSFNELRAACLANVGNTQGIFQSFGIGNCDSALQGMVEGRVTSDNKVYIGDQLVATNAVSAGRQRLSASDTPIAGGAAYRRAPSVSFNSSSLKAFVRMENGVFKYAIITSCGNPVNGTPNTPPPPPPPVVVQETPNFDIVKDVRIQGEQAWQQNVVAQPNQKLEYRIVVRNTGETVLTNVVIRDAIPTQVQYQSGSIRINGQSRTGNIADGFNVGNIGVGKSLELVFVVTVKAETEACGTNYFTNIAFAKPGDLPEESDNATTQVCKPQTPPPPPPPPTPVTPVAATTPTKQLPATGGVGSAAGIFTVTTILGTAYYRLRGFYEQLLNK